jgi:hypothetical protein
MATATTTAPTTDVTINLPWPRGSTKPWVSLPHEYQRGHGFYRTFLKGKRLGIAASTYRYSARPGCYQVCDGVDGKRFMLITPQGASPLTYEDVLWYLGYEPVSV